MTGRPPPPSAPPPHTRFGSYSLIQRLAVGGMAEVFLAQEPRAAGAPRSVVVKRMLPHIASEPGAKAMFAEEARLGRLVNHDNVVRVLDFGETDGTPFLVLEYVRGVDLWRMSRWLTKAGRSLGVEMALFITREVLAALSAVHEATDEEGHALGMVHRDVSPSNVLLSQHGQVKLADFGIAQTRLRERFPQRASANTRARGKLGYLAPEQVTGETTDLRADVFSAAVIAAELLMGRPLFAGGSELAVLLAIRDAKIHPFLEIMGSLPTGLGETIVEGLASSPADRIASAAELSERLAAFQQDRPDALRMELADLVGAALEDELGTDRLTGPPPADDRLTPVKATETSPPDTGDYPVLSYEVVLADGSLLGPWSYARLVEAVATGKVGPMDRIREGAEEHELRDMPDLCQHIPALAMDVTTRRIEEPSAPVEEHDLGEGGVVGAMAALALRQDTGLLLCELGDVRKEVYVREGSPEFVTSNLAGELLGEFLVSHGVINRGELDMALAVMPRFEGRLGDTLVGLGLVEPVHLFQHIGAQVREKLLDLFCWTSGKAAFYRGVPPPARGFPLGLDSWTLLAEGIGRRVEQGLEPELISHRDRFLIAADPKPPVLQLSEAPLPEGVQIVLGRLGEARTLADLAEEAGEDAVPLLNAVILLVRIEAARWL